MTRVINNYPLTWHNKHFALKPYGSGPIIWQWSCWLGHWSKGLCSRTTALRTHTRYTLSTHNKRAVKWERLTSIPAHVSAYLWLITGGAVKHPIAWCIVTSLPEQCFSVGARGRENREAFSQAGKVVLLSPAWQFTRRIVTARCDFTWRLRATF